MHFAFNKNKKLINKQLKFYIMKTLQLENVVITKNAKNELTFNVPQNMTGKMFGQFKQKYSNKINTFKNI